MPTLEEIIDEDIDDIDNMDFDPADFDPKNPFAKSNPVNVRSPFGESSSSPSSSTPPPTSSGSTSTAKPFNIPANQPTYGGMPVLKNKEDMEKIKSWQLIYPVYFDKNKSHSEGRRVPLELAVENPLAYTIIDALNSLGISSVFEVAKTHPKDWSNPGRIRVEIRDGTSRTNVKNKRHLYRLIGKYLVNHPSTERTPFETPLYSYAKKEGGVLPDKCSPLAIPTGWKINNILPLTSRALSGGEANDEMMTQMQNEMFPGLNLPDVKPPKKQVIRR